MAKLHIYQGDTKIADGDGTLSSSAPFEVTITSGMDHVQHGCVYKVCQGQSIPHDLYHCTHTDKSTNKATFLRQEANFEGESAYMNHVLTMQAYLAAVEKMVNVEIAEKDFATLKESGYKLCFAKKVGDNDFNVVWQSYNDYLASNEFSWTPQYQLFGTNKFNAGVKVKASTNRINIGLGESSTLNPSGWLQPPVTGGPTTCFTMINEYGPIHPGVNQLCTGLGGEQISSPIYVAPSQAVEGEVKLTPVEKVLVWFEQNIETSTMFSGSRSLSIEIDLTKDNSATRQYKDGKWRLV